MKSLTLQLPPLHDAQREVWNHPARFKVVSAGRRFGKSRYGSLRCIVEAMQGGRAWWIAPSYPVAAVGWRMLQQLGKQIPGVEIKQVDRILAFPTGGMVQVRSADNPDSLRGEGLNYAVLDECAFIKEDTWTQAIRPALADRQGGALFISTPKGRNWFWRIWQQGIADGVEWHAWQFPTVDNPYVPASEVEAARKSLPEAIFRQEFLAEFVEDSGEVFRRVMEAAIATPQETAQPKHEYIIGVDWGKHNDFTALAVIDLTTSELVYLDRFNQIDYTLQRRRLEALYRRFHPHTILAERNSIGDPAIEELSRAGLPIQAFTTTNASKAQAIDGLSLAFEQSIIRILNDPTLIGELQAYEMERLPSGMLRYSAPEGMHDDTVMALAIAWYGAQNTGPAFATESNPFYA